MWFVEWMLYQQTDQPTNQPTNQPTDTASYRGAWSHLKIIYTYTFFLEHDLTVKIAPSCAPWHSSWSFVSKTILSLIKTKLIIFSWPKPSLKQNSQKFLVISLTSSNQIPKRCQKWWKQLQDETLALRRDGRPEANQAEVFFKIYFWWEIYFSLLISFLTYFEENGIYLMHAREDVKRSDEEEGVVPVVHKATKRKKESLILF